MYQPVLPDGTRKFVQIKATLPCTYIHRCTLVAGMSQFKIMQVFDAYGDKRDTSLKAASAKLVSSGSPDCQDFSGA